MIDQGIDLGLQQFLGRAEIEQHALRVARAGECDIHQPGRAAQAPGVIEYAAVDVCNVIDEQRDAVRASGRGHGAAGRAMPRSGSMIGIPSSMR